MRLLNQLRTVLLGTSIVLLTSCAAWHSGQKDGNTAEADTNANSAQTNGLGDDSSVQGGATTASTDQDLGKHTYYFAYDQSEVRAEDKPAIEANARYLVAHPNAKALIEGHTDPRGSREYNIALGERRSKAIQDIFREEGVNPSQIRIISYGAEKLASNGHSDSDYQLDRRGVLVYLQQ